jgi:hypothetical protein
VTRGHQHDCSQVIALWLQVVVLSSRMQCSSVAAAWATAVLGKATVSTSAKCSLPACGCSGSIHSQSPHTPLGSRACVCLCWHTAVPARPCPAFRITMALLSRPCRTTARGFEVGVIRSPADGRRSDLSRCDNVRLSLRGRCLQLFCVVCKCGGLAAAQNKISADWVTPVCGLSAL